MENRRLRHIKGREKIGKMLESAIVLVPVLLFLASCAPTTFTPLPTPTLTVTQKIEKGFHPPGSETHGNDPSKIDPVTFKIDCITSLGPGTQIFADPLQKLVIYTVPPGEHLEVWNAGVSNLAPNMMFFTMRDTGGNMLFVPWKYFTNASNASTGDNGCTVEKGQIIHMEPLGQGQPATEGIIFVQVVGEDGSIRSISIARGAIMPGPVTVR